MVEFRPDTSFPYLKIARAHGVPYGVVLQCADDLEQLGACKNRGLGPDALLSIHRAVSHEQRRRAMVLGQGEIMP